MAVRDDVRLEQGPLQPVSCAACGAEVAARKSSWDQTTVQWTAAALQRCPERRAASSASDRPNRNAFPGCPALKRSVREAAVRGDLDVLSGEPLKTNPDHVPEGNR